MFSNGLLYASHSDRWFGINKNTNRTNDTKSINDNFFRSRKKLKTRKGRKYYFNTNLTNDTKSINGNDNVNDNFFRSRKKLKTLIARMTLIVLTITSTITITFLDHEKKLKTRKGRK